MPTAGAVLQQIVPPALLTYFAWAWRRCTFDIARDLFWRTNHRPFLALLYASFTSLSIPTLSIVFLRLYFLPARVSEPPPLLPHGIASYGAIFECVPPSRAIIDGYMLWPKEGDVDEILLRCDKGRCRGRWKPARARHCSECGRCRMGFDHHCAFFANCLSAPYIPAFLILVLATPIVTTLLSAPLYLPLIARTRAAWRAALTDPVALRWWSWKPSWIVAGGPIGRWGVGLALGWRALDLAGGSLGGPYRFEIAALALVGNLIGAVTLALGVSTLMLVRRGDLTVDRERERALARARAAAAEHAARGHSPPPALAQDLNRFAVRHWFFVPVQTVEYAGIILPTLPEERPYDLGSARDNFERIVARGRGWAWTLPWNACRAGMAEDEIVNWPISEAVRNRLQVDALKIVAVENDDDDDGAMNG